MAGSRQLSALGAHVTDSVAAAIGDLAAPILIALSGGADSAVLAWAIEELGLEGRALHVHHGWPGSDRLAGAASEVGERLGITAERVDVDTSGLGSPESVAREARYEALEKARATGERIATGHTLTDQAETVIGNLMWGSGLDGLAGIHPKRTNLVRPMLGVSRSDTRELATLLGLPFVDDPANSDVTYRRVRIRNAISHWEANLAPGVSARLAETAQLVRADVELLTEMTERVTIDQAGSAVRIPAGALRSIEDGLARRVVRRALRLLGGGHPGTRADVEAVMAVAFGAAPTEVTGGHRVTRAGASVQIGPVETCTAEAGAPASLRWEVPGSTRWSGWTWTGIEHEGLPGVYPLSPWSQVFDAELLGSGHTLEIRSVAADDRLAMRSGHKQASDAFAEAGIPADERRRWPVLTVGGTAVWIPGVRRAFAGWVTNDLGRYLVVSAVREERWKPVAS